MSERPVFDFEEQRKLGKLGEEFLDRKFAGKWNIAPVAVEEERRLGIDRRWKHREFPGLSLDVEYKTDAVADESGNAIIEVVSNTQTAAAGWALKSRAEPLVYLLWHSKTILVAPMPLLRLWTPVWIARFNEVKSVPNHGYDTLNICVPLPTFKKVCAAEMQCRQEVMAWCDQ